MPSFNDSLKARAERTDKLIQGFRGAPGEYYMLKGLLCASTVVRGADEKRFESLFNMLMIAARMDELEAEQRANANNKAD